MNLVKLQVILLASSTIVSCGGHFKKSLATEMDIEISNKEVCVYSDESESLQCSDRSLPDGQQSYSRGLETGDIVTNGEDFIQGVNESIELMKKLRACKASL